MLEGLKIKQLKGGDAVAWVRKSSVSGDRVRLFGDAIELYDTPRSPILNIEVNRKAKILRDPCGYHYAFAPHGCNTNDRQVIF